ncbi:type IV toxin-antitoxin system AbiEi family antitoxin domain-containing protein [Klenkia sp. PcliD-1-E]|uniref:type IV toxin-antitoxin system AbiEi family antitoxin domain-containing protein n=1 Tax=Klenkia sp. PcliD-1-E TaxID=2954492 RepID=UPI002097D77C|nr:type IV toxin-antitoxin system AbiEi family antitoxin domain-containing protein [Klenkia sp. PcliD-1-E]MCO7222138.1 type IV toxin-antitoxin system AbiEi family antitoxin domain-containing protein [Klenkia sp. PcliD-1-E]
MHPLIRAALERNGGVFTTADAVASGVPRTAIPALLRAGTWHRVRYGVYTTGPIWRQHAAAGTDHDLECAAVVLRLGRPAVVSHTSAARLHGLVLPAEPPPGVWLTDPAQFRVGKGYRVLEAPVGADATTHGVLRITSLPRTLADVGRSWAVEDTVVAVDDALADGRTTPAELTAAALAQTHWVGAGQAATAFGLSAVGAHSPHETRTRLRVVGAGFPQPLLQVAVWRGNRLVAVLDMYWPEHGVFGNCDGKVKVLDPWGGRTAAEAVWREKSQHDELVDIGLRGTHIKPGDLYVGWAAKVASLERLFAAPRPALADGVRLVQHNGGLRDPGRPSRSA